MLCNNPFHSTVSASAPFPAAILRYRNRQRYPPANRITPAKPAPSPIFPVRVEISPARPADASVIISDGRASRNARIPAVTVSPAAAAAVP